MFNIYKARPNNFLVLVITLLSFFLGGCAIGTTRIDVNHEPLKHIENKKEGNVLVAQFTDNREDTHKGYIGNKRNGFGMVLGHFATKEGVKLELVLTKYFAEALEEAGYKVTIQEEEASTTQDQANFDLIINGEINQFWLDLYMAVWHYLDVNIQAVDPSTQGVVWEKSIKGAEKNVLWIGLSAEFEKVISQSLTKALNRAILEFSSDNFYIALTDGESLPEKGAGSVKATRQIDGPKTTAEQLQELKTFYENDLISKDEYDEKRKEVLENHF